MLQDYVADIARAHLRKIKKTGSDNIMAICPFHRRPDGQEEATPSFSMSLTKGLFFCFACQEKGNLYTFLRKVGVSRERIGKDYKELLDSLSSRIEPPKNFARKPPVSTDPLPENLLGLFDYCPTGLIKEGFKEELLQEYDVGFDKDHMRITYPLRDMKGNLMGISGRTVTDEFPRYKVYDVEYSTWQLPRHHTDKRQVLWNYHRVFPNSFYKRDAFVIVVEGFKACLWLIQHGLKDTVALLGTHLSDEHLMMLEHLGSTVYLMLDNNKWGRIGTAKVGAKLAKSLNVRIVEYPEERNQPSDLSPEEIVTSVANAEDYYLWAMEERNRWLLERTQRTLEM